MIRRLAILGSRLRPRRRWARFSLRGLLVLTVIAALGFTWVRSHLRVYRQEQQFLAELQQSAGPGAPKTRVEIVGNIPDF